MQITHELVSRADSDQNLCNVVWRDIPGKHLGGAIDHLLCIAGTVTVALTTSSISLASLSLAFSPSMSVPHAAQFSRILLTTPQQRGSRWRRRDQTISHACRPRLQPHCHSRRTVLSRHFVGNKCSMRTGTSSGPWKRLGWKSSFFCVHVARPPTWVTTTTTPLAA